VKITATNDAGKRHDITVAVQVLYDLYHEMLEGSGFLDGSESQMLTALEDHLGWPVDGDNPRSHTGRPKTEQQIQQEEFQKAERGLCTCGHPRFHHLKKQGKKGTDPAWRWEGCKVTGRFDPKDGVTPPFNRDCDCKKFVPA
jgi:hypothetical protein